MTRLIKTVILILFLPVLAQSQDHITAKKHVREGMDLYNKGITTKDSTHLAQAEISFKKAVEIDPAYTDAMYDAGAALYKQGKYEDASKTFEAVSKIESDKTKLAKTYHNIGNSYLQKKDYKKAVDAYKNALRNNPKDVETKYNLAYAQKKLKEQQQQQKNGSCNKDQQQDQQNKDQKDKDKQNQDKQNQNKDQQNKDNKDQQQQQQNQENQDKKDQQSQQNKQDNQKEGDQQKQQQQQGKEGEQKEGQQQKKQQGELSKKDAERLLQSIQRNENKLQQKISGKKKKGKGKRVKIEKDW